MSKLANLAHRIICRLPDKTVRKWARKKLFLPFYHLASDEEVPHVKHLYRCRTLKEFTTDLDFLLRHFQPVGLREVLSWLHHGGSLPENAFHLTFDDGLCQLYDPIAPLLEKKGVPATFFLTTDFLDNKSLGFAHEKGLLLFALESKPARSPLVESVLRSHGIEAADAMRAIRKVRYDQQDALDEIAPLLDVDFKAYLSERKPYVTTDQVKHLIRRGFTIGAHSIDHPLYSQLALREQIRQTTESVRLLKERFALDYAVFAFPFSDRNVTSTYFEETLDRGGLHASFGASGLVDDAQPRNLQRLWMEYGDASAKQRVRAEFADFALMKLTGCDKIKRWP
jgi:peptidoglycan/xylan/chitin deacetylase (PgdA/CDA1 family)